MADIKPTSFRINEDDIAKFKEFADKEGLNQAEAFKSIMQTVEMAKAKNLIKDRAKEIEVFQDTINNLMNMFLNSLNVNQTSEERIREELSKELNTKDDTISTLHDHLQQVKAANLNLTESNKLLNESTDNYSNTVKKLNLDIQERQKHIDKLNSNNDLLQDQLKEYKEYKDNYNSLDSEFKALKAHFDALNDKHNKLLNEKESLNNKLQDAQEMLSFYKNELDTKDKDINEYKADIKKLEAKYNQELSQLKKEHKLQVEKQLHENIENISIKHSLEISKKDLEIDKLNNKIEQLEAKTSHKTKTAKQTGFLDK